MIASNENMNGITSMSGLFQVVWDSVKKINPFVQDYLEVIKEAGVRSESGGGSIAFWVLPAISKMTSSNSEFIFVETVSGSVIICRTGDRLSVSFASSIKKLLKEPGLECGEMTVAKFILVFGAVVNGVRLVRPIAERVKEKIYLNHFEWTSSAANMKESVVESMSMMNMENVPSINVPMDPYEVILRMKDLSDPKPTMEVPTPNVRVSEADKWVVDRINDLARKYNLTFMTGKTK